MLEMQENFSITKSEPDVPIANDLMIQSMY